MATRLAELELDLVTRGHLEKGLESLHHEFACVFGSETIERFMAESLSDLGPTRLADFVPLFVHRFARERLRALAQAESKLTKEVPEVLFVCVHNAGRSQMAAGLLERLAGGRVRVRSAGSDPADELNPAAVEAMREVGIDLSQELPKPLSDEFVRAADVVVTMGCGDSCPVYPGKRYEDWELEDPAGKDLETVRRIRDEIEQRVRALLDELEPTSASSFSS
jgi:arsenate reductase (thioredoxin)